MYSKREVKKATVEYFDGDILASDVFINKYALKDVNNELLEKSPEDMHRRMAREFARIESKYEGSMSENEIFELFDKFRYIIPQGSPMAGIGNDTRLTTLSNCYVIASPKDSYAEILNTEREMIELMKRRGGVGFSIHSLRPKDVPTNTVAIKSSGLVLFSERYSRGTREVAQDGRRGALMLSCRIDHPDIIDFINSKLDRNMITGANISVMIPDDFMRAVENKEMFEVEFYSKVTGRYSAMLNAPAVWNLIIKNSWKSAEPGVIFWDNVLRESPAGVYGEEWKETSCNPCSELPLCPYDSCRLLAVNLFGYVDNPFTDKSSFNWNKFEDHTRKAQRLLDDLIELEIEKIQRIIDSIKNDTDAESDKNIELKLWNKILNKAIKGRRTGLGITAEGDMIAALGMKYGTKEATDFAVEVHRRFAVNSYKESIQLAKERGAFEIWDITKDSESTFVKRILGQLDDKTISDYTKYGRRNIANLTIAPTGSVSAMAQTTSGIEPVVFIYYTRRRKINPEDNGVNVDYVDENGDSWQEYKLFHPKFEMWYDLNWYKLKSEWFDLDYKPSLEYMDDKELEFVIEKSPYSGATSVDIDWRESVSMQGGIQKWIDHSISKTINLPENVKPDVVDECFREAHKSGCKGVTVYREGSRSGVLINSKNNKFNYQDAMERKSLGDNLRCHIYQKQALNQMWSIIVGLHEGKPFEVFALEQPPNSIFPHKIRDGYIQRVKSGHYRLMGKVGNKNYVIDNILNYMKDDEQVDTRKYSLMLRGRISPESISDEIAKYATVSSFDKVIQRVFSNYIETKGSCPECGGELIRTDGCIKCKDCTYSVCL